MALDVKVIFNKDTLCQTTCGMDWSNQNVQKLITGELRKKYGRNIKIKYSAGDGPRLIINGQVRLSGQFDQRERVEIIETQLEAGV